MFGLLKNKLASFIKGLAGKEQEKTPAESLQEKPQEKIAQKPAESPQEKTAPKQPEIAPAQMPASVPEKPAAEERQAPLEKKPEPMPAKPVAKTSPAPIIESPKPAGRAPEKKAAPSFAAPAEAKKPEIKPIEEKKPETKPAQVPLQMPAQPQKKSVVDSVMGVFSRKPSTQPTGPDISKIGQKAMSEKKGMAPKIGVGTAIKSIFSNEITIGESEVSDLLEELELSLLEADVAYEVSLEVSSLLRKELVGMKVPKGEVEKRTREAISRILESVMESDRKFDFVGRIKGMHKPVKVLFVGPNGAGKTTTMAKVAHLLLDNGLTAVFSASDTFRAAAIEQTEVHAGRLGIKAIKSKYGADPASVAFDAVNYAASHSIDVVLIDSAGRQDTNANLLSELKKIVRVAKPDIKLYIGESIGGNALIEQIRAFNEAIGIDGAILTKIDCDAKGGTAISVAKATGAPVLYLGVGQNYSDLEPFDAHKIAQEIMA
ncbi:Signal recognition particle receptor FtsY [uncultured archaeon]|nr:Signal recognition particle receptor FtsY [uncultured archaeon]